MIHNFQKYILDPRGDEVTVQKLNQSTRPLIDILSVIRSGYIFPLVAAKPSIVIRSLESPQMDSLFYLLLIHHPSATVREHCGLLLRHTVNMILMELKKLDVNNVSEVVNHHLSRLNSVSQECTHIPIEADFLKRRMNIVALAINELIGSELQAKRDPTHLGALILQLFIEEYNELLETQLLNINTLKVFMRVTMQGK
jgi:hypothetical protein